MVAWQKPKIRPDWMRPAQYEAFPDRLRLREFKASKQVLVTPLLSDKDAPKKVLAAWYQQRTLTWIYATSKTPLGLETLSCKTPAMNEKERWVYFLAYNLIRLIMAQAARQADLLPRRLSFKHTLQIWLTWRRQPFVTSDSANTALLFMLIAAQHVGNRSGRTEPRAIKRRPKPYPLLMKPRDEARVEVLIHGYPRKLK